MTMLGHVTSSYWSETLGRSIALAVVAGGRATRRPDPARADAGQDPCRRDHRHGVRRSGRQAPERLGEHHAAGTPPADGSAHRGHRRTSPPWPSAPSTDCARFNLRIAPADTWRAPPRPSAAACRTRSARRPLRASKLALCLGPDEWQLYAPLAASDAIEAAFAAALRAVPAQPGRHRPPRDRHQRRRTRGRAGASLGLRFRSRRPWPTGTGMRTIFDKAQIVLIRHGDDRFRIEVWRSFATHVWGLLEAASQRNRTWHLRD